MSISIVRKTFKLDDEITLDDGTVLIVQRKTKVSLNGKKNTSSFHLVVSRAGHIGKITVVKPQHNQEVVDGNR